MVSSGRPRRRGRAFGSIYGAQLGGMAIGPLVGSLVGLGSMDVLFVAAGAAGLVACLPVLVGTSVAGQDAIDVAAADAAAGHTGLPTLNRSLIGAVMAAAAFGLTIGVYESCWTLLLELRHAEDWEIGLSWTLFAAPFVVMARPGGWLADHLDRRRLAVGSLSVSITLSALYPFLHSLFWLLVLGSLEALATAIALPAAQSMLTQYSASTETGRVQGLFSTAETGSIAVAAAAGGALFRPGLGTVRRRGGWRGGADRRVADRLGAGGRAGQPGRWAGLPVRARRVSRRPLESQCQPRSVTVRAEPEEVEAVLGDLVALSLGYRPGRVAERPLEARGRVHVLDLAARRTDEVVVMVAGQILGQLEAAVVVGAGHPADDADVDQRRHVAVGAALREGRRGLEDLGHRQWAPGGAERVDQHLPHRRVPLVDRGQAEAYFVVDGRAGCHDRRD